MLRYQSAKEIVLANPPSQKETIFDMPEIYALLMRFLTLADASRFRQAFKKADMAFYKYFAHHPDRLLRELGYLTPEQLQKFIESKIPLAFVIWDQLKKSIDNPAAYACYALIGYVNNLDLKRIEHALEYLNNNNFPPAVIKRLEYVKSRIVCADGKQDIVFIDIADLFAALLTVKKIPELARLRETCRMANSRFNHILFDNPAGVLLAADQLTDNQLRKFLINNAAHIESLEPFVANYDAAYASYALLGGVNLLNSERLSSVLTFLREQHVSQLIIHCVELVHAVYCPSANFRHNFFDLLRRMAKDYLDDHNLGTLRPLFLDVLFRATRSLENDDSRPLDDRYRLVNEFLNLALKHELFSMHRNTGLLPGRLFAVQRGGNTRSQYVIAAEKQHVSDRYHAKAHLTHTNLSK